MADTSSKRETPDVRVVVEVDGNPVGFLTLDMDRLWPLISHQERDGLQSEWMDPAKFNSILRLAVVQRLTARLQTHLYRTLGDEIVKAALDIETLTLKAETVAQTFGRKKSDIEKLVAESGRTAKDFDAFLMQYLLDDSEDTDLKKAWKASRTRPQ